MYTHHTLHHTTPYNWYTDYNFDHPGAFDEQALVDCLEQLKVCVLLLAMLST